MVGDIWVLVEFELEHTLFDVKNDILVLVDFVDYILFCLGEDI